MSYERRILHHGPSPAGAPQLLSERAIQSCWFELQRQGGCGAAEVILSDDFEQRSEVEIGDWISLEPEAGVRWYLGRVDERRAESPARIRLRLEGMSIELNEIFPGGFGEGADGRKPHRYAATDLFPHDPDYGAETFDSVTSAEQVVSLLMTQYGGTSGHIVAPPERIETPALAAPVTSLKLRGEESIRALLKELAVRAQSASWGVDAQGEFFFLRPRNAILATYREGTDLTDLAEVRDRETLFNRILLTGDYIYDAANRSDALARSSSRWRGNFIEPISQEAYGDRRIRIWLPWIRTQNDSVAFAREFFRTYSQPQSRYFVETGPQGALPIPWEGRVQLENQAGDPLIIARIETLRVLFDHAIRFRMELGPDDPRDLWPEPPQDERWPLPDRLPIGGLISLPSSLSDGTGGGGHSNSETDEGTGPSLQSSGSDFSASTGSEADSEFGSSAPSEGEPPESSDDGVSASPSSDEAPTSEGDETSHLSSAVTVTSLEDEASSSLQNSSGSASSSAPDDSSSAEESPAESTAVANSSEADQSSLGDFSTEAEPSSDAVNSTAEPSSSDPESSAEESSIAASSSAASSSEGITFIWP